MPFMTQTDDQTATLATTGMTQCPDCASPLLDPQPRSMFPECQEAGMILHFVCGREDGASGQIADPDTWIWRFIEQPPACREIAKLREEVKRTQEQQAEVEEGYTEILVENQHISGTVERITQFIDKLIQGTQGWESEGDQKVACDALNRVRNVVGNDGYDKMDPNAPRR